MKTKIAAIVLAALLTLSGTSVLQAQKEFPVWSEGLFAHIYTKYGEEASKRLREVYIFIKVHLNDPVEVQLEEVNEYLNGMTWIADSDLWKQPDYWATPFETITTFGGDCEDIAIAKYTVLRLMGVPDDHMGFAHVVTSTGEHHMVLLYQKSDQDDVLILDNQRPDIQPAPERKDLIGVYAFKNDGTLILIKDEGDAKRTVKSRQENRQLKKWLTAKERARENSKSLVAFNEGKPLQPDWTKADQ